MCALPPEAIRSLAYRLDIPRRALCSYLDAEGRLKPLMARKIQLALRADVPLRFIEALEAIEVPDCDCKLSMTPNCLIGREPGCRERQRFGSCPCRPRWRPECQLHHPGGCERRREGKRCGCDLFLMPECLSPGCNERRKGKLCNCPRWPGLPCVHVTSQAARLRYYAAARVLEAYSPHGYDPDAGWYALLFLLYPKRYRGPLARGAPALLLSQEARVEKMAFRRAKKIQLWHPLDIRHRNGDEAESRIESNCRAFLAKLQAPPANERRTARARLSCA